MIDPKNSISLNQQLELYKSRGLNKRLEDNLPIFREIFEQLQTLEKQSANNDNFDKAVGFFYQIFDIVPIMYSQLDGSDIFRAQSNGVNELFTTQERISYNKINPSIISPGKFNVWYDPVFYGCVPYRPEKARYYLEPYMVACYETCKGLKDPNKQLFVQDFTIGQWKTKSAFNVINLCFDEYHLSLNPELRSANGRYLEGLKSVLNSEAHDFIKSLFNYYSSLCRTGTNEKSYYILTAFFDAIRIYYNEEGVEINGLISASAASSGAGLNIVLTPQAVETLLYLNSVFMYRFFLVSNENKFYTAYPCGEIVYNTDKKQDFDYQFKNHLNLSEDFVSRRMLKN